MGMCHPVFMKRVDDAFAAAIKPVGIDHVRAKIRAAKPGAVPSIVPGGSAFS